MPDWFKELLPDMLKDYAVAIAAGLTAAIGTGLLVVVRLLYNRFTARLSKDEKTLLRWAYDSPGNSVIVIDGLGKPLTVTVMGTNLDKDRERWLLAFERLEQRGFFDKTGEGVYRLKPSAMALAKEFKPVDPKPHELPQPPPPPPPTPWEKVGISEEAAEILCRAWRGDRRVYVLKLPGIQIVRLAKHRFGDEKDKPTADRYVRALHELVAKALMDKTKTGDTTDCYDVGVPALVVAPGLCDSMPPFQDEQPAESPVETVSAKYSLSVDATQLAWWAYKEGGSSIVIVEPTQQPAKGPQIARYVRVGQRHLREGGPPQVARWLGALEELLGKRFAKEKMKNEFVLMGNGQQVGIDVEQLGGGASA